MPEHRYAYPGVGVQVYQAFRWWGAGTSAASRSSWNESLSGVPVVGCRNASATGTCETRKSIRRSGGGVPEHHPAHPARPRQVYQAFRWWGAGTDSILVAQADLSLSGVPVVGCRNLDRSRPVASRKSIRRSGGGVPEHAICRTCQVGEVYQAFRWWGAGTFGAPNSSTPGSLSGVPVVGCRNVRRTQQQHAGKSIRRSGGGVPELISVLRREPGQVYQAFRWWGAGTCHLDDKQLLGSLSGVPVVGCRNGLPDQPHRPRKSIRRSGGGVPERQVTLPRRA